MRILRDLFVSDKPGLLSKEEDQSTLNYLRNIDLKNRDEAGFDPYHLRDSGQPSTVPEDISARQLIAQYNLCGHSNEETLPTETNSLNEKTIPKLIHFIWVGSPMSRDDLKKNILTFREKNPDVPIILWTDQMRNDEFGPHSQAVGNMVQWCKDNNIALLSVDEIFNGKMELEKHYRLEIQRRNFGAATDALRLDILDRFGGVYSDIDIKCKKQLSFETQSGIKLNGGERSYGGPTVDTLTNDLIMAGPHHKDIRAFKNQIKNYYAHNFSHLFGNEHRRKKSIIPNIDYEKGYHEILSDEIYNLSTLRRTGPGVIENYYGDSRYEIIKPDGFDFESLKTWQSPAAQKGETTPAEKAEQIKLVLNALLRDLQDEPRILRLDLYAKTIIRYDIANVLLHMLSTYYPDKLKQVQHCQFLKSCDNSAAIDFITNNKDVFPNLRIDKNNLFNQFISAIETSANLPNAETLTWLVKKQKFDLKANDYMCTLFKNWDKKTTPAEFKEYYLLVKKLGASVNDYVIESDKMKTALCYFVNKINRPEDIDCLKILLADANEATLNNKNDNPLMLLCNKMENEVTVKNGTTIKAIECLLNCKGINIYISNDRGSPLYCAVINSKFDIVKLLLHQGAVPDNNTLKLALDMLKNIDEARRTVSSSNAAELQKKFDEFQSIVIMLETKIGKLGDQIKQTKPLSTSTNTTSKILSGLQSVEKSPFDNQELLSEGLSSRIPAPQPVLPSNTAPKSNKQINLDKQPVPEPIPVSTANTSFRR